MAVYGAIRSHILWCWHVVFVFWVLYFDGIALTSIDEMGNEQLGMVELDTESNGDSNIIP